MTTVASRDVFKRVIPYRNAVLPPPIRREFSVLRKLVPLRLIGAGPVANLLSSAYLNREPLIHMVLGTLEDSQIDLPIRAAFADAFQQLLEGEAPQRDLRRMFEAIELQYRSKLNFEEGQWKYDPAFRLEAFQQRMAALYYATMLGVSATPQDTTETSLRAMLNSDIGVQEGIFTDIFRALEDSEKRPLLPPEYRKFIGDMAILERDVFGMYRLDGRGNGQRLIHCIKASDVGQSHDSVQLLSDPTIEEHGNFFLIEDDSNPRWVSYELMCGNEDHKVLPDLPDTEYISVSGEGWKHKVQLIYNSPLVTKRLVHAHKLRTGDQCTEKFELNVTDKNRSFFERFFLDR